MAMALVSANTLAADIEVRDPVIREAPPGMQVLAGYMTVVNNSQQNVVITGAESKQFGRIELHDVIMQEGMARMVQMEQVEVAAGKSFTFQQGAKHLMMFDPASALKAGDSVEVKLLFADGSQQLVVYQVKRLSAPAGGHQHHHHQE
jgi:copper(I)-binding protein